MFSVWSGTCSTNNIVTCIYVLTVSAEADVAKFRTVMIYI